MRVLLAGDILGGVRTYLVELARGLAAAGVDVDVALLGAQPDAELERELAGTAASSWQALDASLEWMHDGSADVSAAAAWIEELRAATAPDILHMNAFVPVVEPDVPVLLTAHSCVSTWWRAVRGSDPPPLWDRYRALVASALGRAELVVTPTAALLRDLDSIYGRVSAARVIANGLDVPRTAPGPRERLVVTAGRLWDPAKNARLLAAAAPRIHARVVAAGDGRFDGVACVGPLPRARVLGLMRRAAVYCEPARYEPFGLSALEAALCGCALVLGDIPSLREVWGRAASYVSPDDPEALAHEVNLLLDDEQRRAAAARDALAVAAGYSRSRMVGGYLGGYHAAIGAREEVAPR